MERAARLIKSKEISAGIATPEELLRAAWPVAVGRIIASHTSRIRLVRTTLVVEVEDAIWQRQLHTLSRQIVDRLHKVTGGCAVTALEFRIGVPRMQAARAETPRCEAVADECDGIRDPVLKKVYKLSRAKVTA